MPLKLLALNEGHLQRYAEIAGNSFHNSGCVTHRAMFPLGVTPESQKYFLDYQRVAFRETRGVVFLGVFDLSQEEEVEYVAPIPNGHAGSPPPREDQSLSASAAAERLSTSEEILPTSAASEPPEIHPSPSKLIAVARLRLEDEATFQEAKQARVPPPGSNAEAFTALFSQFGAEKLKQMGSKTYWMLDSLTTATEAQGRGAGRMIVNWMTQTADQTRADDGSIGVECYLEASEMGKPLYDKCGFETVAEVSIHATRFGQPRNGSFSIMVRPARNSKNARATAEKGALVSVEVAPAEMQQQHLIS